MTVSLWIRQTVGGKRTYRKPNKKKLYPNSTVFCLRYSIEGKPRWGDSRRHQPECCTRGEGNQGSGTAVSRSHRRIRPCKTDQRGPAMGTYLSTVAATRAHKTWLAYNLILNEFRKTCAKEYLEQIDKSELTALVVAQKKDGQDDRTVANAQTP